MGNLSTAQLLVREAAAARRVERDAARRWPESRSELLAAIRLSEHNNRLNDLRSTRSWLNRDLRDLVVGPSNVAALSVPTAQEDHAYLREVCDVLERQNGHDQALWFLENCEDCQGSGDRSERPLTRVERARRLRMRVRLRAELGEP